MTVKHLSLAAQPDPTRGPVPASDAIDAEPSIDPVHNDQRGARGGAGRLALSRAILMAAPQIRLQPHTNGASNE
jgi:hypothetical protein